MQMSSMSIICFSSFFKKSHSSISIDEIIEIFRVLTWNHKSRVAEMFASSNIFAEQECYYPNRLILSRSIRALSKNRQHFAIPAAMVEPCG